MKDHGVDWAGLRVRDGVGMDPGPIRDMLCAPDSRSGDEAYWRIEGTAFYSYELEEASEPVTQILIDAVCDGVGTPLGLMFATDMLVEITCGYTSPSEEEVSSAGLADRCRAIVRHRLPRLYRLVVLGPLSETRPAAQLGRYVDVGCASARPAAPAAPGDWRPLAPSPPRAARPTPRDRGIAQPLATKSIDRLRAAWDDRSLVLLASSACSARAPA